jgi:hypothetical protein
VPRIDVIDSTWIPARRASLARLIADPENWPGWWPDLPLVVAERRGENGVRWTVPTVRDGVAAGFTGSAEVWLQAMFDGTVAHLFLRLDPVRSVLRRPVSRRCAVRVERFYRERTKQVFWQLADDADPARVTRMSRVGRPPERPGAVRAAG